jgi:hypothetical protein
MGAEVMAKNATWLQILREVDKLDRVGAEGVFDRLTKGAKDESGAFVPGVGLPAGKAALLLGMIAGKPIIDRIAVMHALESHENPDGSTAWDEFLALPTNVDNTWRDGKRPKNIAWAIDDLIVSIRKRADQIGAG